VTLECLLEEEVRSLVGASKWERAGSRKGVRNGSYLRTLLTSMGQIDVRISRTREAGSVADVVGRYERRTEDLDEAIVSAYVNGVSTQSRQADRGTYRPKGEPLDDQSNQQEPGRASRGTEDGANRRAHGVGPLGVAHG
jgi:hypothetical protein